MKLHHGAQKDLRDILVVYGLPALCKAISEFAQERAQQGDSKYMETCKTVSTLFEEVAKNADVEAFI